MGERVGVTHTSIQKYERGVITPPSSQLLKLARACGICAEYYFRTHAVELIEPEFRRQATFGKTAQEALKIKVINLIEKRLQLLGFFPSTPVLRFKVPANLPERIATLDQLEAFADQVREAWKLGLNPIGDLTDTLETLGLLVIMADEDNPGFSGLTATTRTPDGRTYPMMRFYKERQPELADAADQ